MMSLMPTGMPSMADSARPSFHLADAASAAARAASASTATKAPTSPSSASIRAMQRSRKSRGLSSPVAKPAVAAK